MFCCSTIKNQDKGAFFSGASGGRLELLQEARVRKSCPLWPVIMVLGRVARAVEHPDADADGDGRRDVAVAMAALGVGVIVSE